MRHDGVGPRHGAGEPCLGVAGLHLGRPARATVEAGWTSVGSASTSVQMGAFSAESGQGRASFAP